jgi:hypothetical protein
MSLRDDVQAGLAAVAAPGGAPLALDGSGSCAVPVPMPPQVARLRDSQLVVTVQVARTGRYVSLRTPLAQFASPPQMALYETLLQRQYYPDLCAGMALALSTDDNTLCAVYHWSLDAIAPEQFAALFTRYAMGAIEMVRMIGAMAQRERALVPVHGDAG